MSGKRDVHYPRFELVEQELIDRVAKTMTNGAEKYGEYNWRNLSGDQIKDIPRHAFIHILKYMQGDTTEDHLSHAACNIMMSMWFEKRQGNTEPVSFEATCDAVSPAPVGFVVYLAGPIDADTHEGASAWRAEMSEKLKSMGVTCFSPYGAYIYSGGKDAVRYVTDVNRYAYLNADLVVAYLPSNVASVGTPLEIKESMEEGVPVLVVSDKEFLMLNGCDRVNSLDDVPAAVRKYIDRKLSPNKNTR